MGLVWRLGAHALRTEPRCKSTCASLIQTWDKTPKAKYYRPLLTWAKLPAKGKAILPVRCKSRETHKEGPPYR